MKLKPGIELLEEIEGIGPAVRKGGTVEVKLNGWLSKGQQIQKDCVKSIILSSRSVIPGIVYAVEGMIKLEQRKIQISPHLDYREEGVKDLIPPNALLVYEIEVLNVVSSA